MRKIFSLLPLFLCILACGTMPPSSTQDVGSSVSATLTAIAQTSSQATAPQPTLTQLPSQVPTATQGVPSGLHYYWPETVPEDFVINASASSASDNGFTLEFINPSVGTVRIVGGEDAALPEYCSAGSTPQIVRGVDGCFPRSTGAGFSVQWREGNFTYLVGGFGLSRDLALQIAERLETLDIHTWQERLKR